MARFTLSVLACCALVTAACTRDSSDATGPEDLGAVDLTVTDLGVDLPVSCGTGTMQCHGTCINTVVDSANCGSCDNVCRSGVTCAAGTCSCMAPMLGCNGDCIDPMSDATNCGGCGHACGPTEQCTDGMCIPGCDAPRSLCYDPLVSADGGVPGVDGGTGPVCVDPQSDTIHCGTCGTHCGGGSVCTGGHCACPAGEIACSGSCTDIMNDPLHCGGCRVTCGAGGTCTGGTCTACDTGLSICPGTPGCVDTETNIFNCGRCGHLCGAMETCEAGGVCSCGGTHADCGAGCTDLTDDPENCGACGISCGAGGVCFGMACTCAFGFTMCGAACADTTADRNHCGDCTTVCAPTEACIGSACVTAPLYHGWATTVPGCSTTSYDATLPTVLGGTYPYNTGDSPSCRAWKLAATVCTTQPVLYDSFSPTDFANWTCPASGGFTDPVFGTYCATPVSAPQYACSSCPGACNATPCSHMPLSLRNCSGVETTQM